MRNAFAKAVYELARGDERVCVLVADISPAGAMADFRREFPSRFVNVGVAEQAMIGLAAGLAQRGYKPFCYTIAAFALFRPYEFIRCDLAYQDLPVMVVGMGAGLSYPTLGGTHQAIEDVAVAMACPNLTVLAPCDPSETRECVRWCGARASGGPVYLRLGKAGEPDLTMGTEAARVRYLRRNNGVYGADTLVLSYGPIAAVALHVAAELDADMATVVQLWPDLEQVARSISPYRRVVVVEEAGGCPVGTQLRAMLPHIDVVRVGLPREFPHEYGSREELLAECGLTAEKILERLQ